MTAARGAAAVLLVVVVGASACRVFGAAPILCDEDAQCDEGDVCRTGACAAGGAPADEDAGRDEDGDEDEDAGAGDEDAGGGAAGDGGAGGDGGPAAACGDGVITPPEACDDDGVAPGDGCSPACAVEAGQECVATPSICGAAADVVTVCASGCDHATVAAAVSGAPAPPAAPRVVSIAAGDHDAELDLNGDAVVLVGAPGARLTTTGDRVVHARGDADVRVVGLELSGAALAAIWADDTARVFVEDSVLSQSEGAAVFGGSTTRVEVRRTSIVDNAGGGAYLMGDAVFENVLVVGNGTTGTGGSYTAGLLFVLGDADVVVRAVTVADNVARPGVDAINCAAPLAVDASIVWGNGAPSLSAGCAPARSDVEGLASSANGNLAVDPLFVDLAGGDARLAPASPCIDAAGASANGLPATDFEGDARPRGAGYDMGADEAG